MIGNQILKRQWIPSLINVVFQTLELPLFLISFCRDLRAFLLLAKAASTASRILLSSTICHKPRAVSRDNWAMHPTQSGENRSIFLAESVAPNSLWRLLKSGDTEVKSSTIRGVNTSMAGMAIAIPGVLNISETGDTMGKIWWHRGKNMRICPKNLLNGQNRCLY